MAATVSQSASQPQAILKVSTKGVDDEGAHKARGGPWNGPRHMFSGRKRHMNSPIMPTKGPLELADAAPSAASDADDLSALVSELTVSEATFAPLASRGAPPPQVLDQIAAAGGIHEQLRESGRHLRFFAGAPGERARLEIRDDDGNLMRTVSMTEAVELAAGRRLA
jgi:hypothetical protein